ncbi:nlp-18 [Pristionchus pacificus]|uniref:Nlp-18 n=1 Tax=Pristionchus pacificus TaxID=54126 RepID=A0A2A6CTA9_PRIPA|nr:nlp-18 [Pristionchus pacificus]|eukprot:PDM81462.1 nlp-18 [Pristionchus pacificus]
MHSTTYIVLISSLACVLLAQQMLEDDQTAEKRMARFAFAKRSPYRTFAFAKRSSAADEDDAEEMDMDKRARFAFAKRSPYRRFAFAKRARFAFA